MQLDDSHPHLQPASIYLYFIFIDAANKIHCEL